MQFLNDDLIYQGKKAVEIYPALCEKLIAPSC